MSDKARIVLRSSLFWTSELACLSVCMKTRSWGWCQGPAGERTLPGKRSWDSVKVPTVGRKGRVVEMPKRSQKDLWVEELPQWRERPEEKQLETGFGGGSSSLKRKWEKAPSPHRLLVHWKLPEDHQVTRAKSSVVEQGEAAEQPQAMGNRSLGISSGF